MRRVALVLPLLLAACGSAHPAHHPAPTARRAVHQRAATPRRLTLLATRTLPAPVQLPALATRGKEALAAGGLDANDQSVATVIRLAPGAPHVAGALPQAVHDAGAATLGGRVYLFGGGTPAGPTDGIVAVARRQTLGRLPAPSSDLEAVRVGDAILVVGGYTGTAPQRSVLAFHPGQAPKEIGRLPHPVRYAAAAAAGSRLLVAGGTDGVHARREVVAFDPATGHARTIGRLPHALAHTAGAVLNGTFYVFGGRGDGVASQRRTIYAIDPRTGKVRRAGRLPAALSDLSAVTLGRRILVAGGRDAGGGVDAELLEYGER